MVTKYNFSNVEKRLFSATVWNTLGNGFAKFIMLAASVFLARILGAEEFGKWGLIRSGIAMFTLFLSFSLSVTAIKYLAKYRETDIDKVGRILTMSFLIASILGGLLTLAVFLSSELLALEYLNDSSMKMPLKVASFFILLMSLNSLVVGALSGLERFKVIAFSNFISGIISAPIIIILTSYFAIDGITVGYLLYYFILFLSLFGFLKKEMKNHGIQFKTKNIKDELDVFYKFSFPALISGSIGGPIVFIVFAFVANLEEGYIMLGLFGAAKIFQIAIVELGSQLQNPLISMLSNENKSKEVFSLSFIIPLIFITIFTLPIIYIPEAVAWIFNEGGYDVNDFIVVISCTLLTASIMIFKQSINRMIVTHNLLWWGVYENIFWSSLLLLFVWLLVPQYGAVGLALSFTLAYFIDLLVIIPFYLAKKLIPVCLFRSSNILVIGTLFISGPFLVYFGHNLILRSFLMTLAFLGMLLTILNLNKKLKL
jgi:O-antigen/teichoic acid export membrane protein